MYIHLRSAFRVCLVGDYVMKRRRVLESSKSLLRSIRLSGSIGTQQARKKMKKKSLSLAGVGVLSAPMQAEILLPRLSSPSSWVWVLVTMEDFQVSDHKEKSFE